MAKRIWPMFALPVLVALGCSAESSSSEEPQPENGERVRLGKGDGAPPGSCKTSSGNLCGGKSKDKCWCDTKCSEYGDCCADRAQVCGGGTGGSSGTGGSGGTAGTGGAVGSCVGSCGKKAASGCWCDTQCQSYGDCCSDIASACGGTGGSGGTGATGGTGGTGGSGGTADIDCAAGEILAYGWHNQIFGSELTISSDGSLKHYERSCCPPSNVLQSTPALTSAKLAELVTRISGAESGTIAEKPGSATAEGSLSGGLAVCTSDGKPVIIRNVIRDGSGTNDLIQYNTATDAKWIQELAVGIVKQDMPF